MAKNGAPKKGIAARDQGHAPPPPPLSPARSKSLKSIAGCRLELIRLYGQVKRGAIDPTVAGRCAFILNTLINSAKDHQLEERLSELEASLKKNGPARPNGPAGPRPWP
jgi:hypothetical protein